MNFGKINSVDSKSPWYEAMDALSLTPSGHLRTKLQLKDWLRHNREIGAQITIIVGKSSSDETWIDCITSEAYDSTTALSGTLDLTGFVLRDETGAVVSCRQCRVPYAVRVIEPPPGATRAWAMVCKDPSCVDGETEIS